MSEEQTEMLTADWVMSEVWGHTVNRIQECTPLCYRQGHVDDIVVTYEKDPLYDRNDPRALGQVEEALRNDGGGEAAVRVIQALAIADEMLISEGAAKAAAAAVRERPTDPAQVVRVWYFRSCH